MLVHRGTNIKNAIKIDLPNGSFIDNADNIISEHLSQIFGKVDGSYFTYSSELKTTTNSKKYKLLLVEDADGDKHHIFFELNIPKKDGILR